MRSIPLEFKYIFLHFLQGYFSTHGKWTWDKDPKKTKIVVSDQFSTETGIVAHRPSVILQRGPINWGKVFRNEFRLPTGQFSENPNLPAGTGNKWKNRHYTDLLNTSVTIRVLTRTSYEADAIANEIFMNLTAYKDDLKPLGIHDISGLSMSGEQQVKAAAEQTFSATTVTCSFVSQKSVGKSQRLYNARVYVDNDEVYEGFAFKVVNNGTAINFDYNIKTSQEVTIDYVDAITLEEENDIVMTRESETLYSIPNGGSIYGYFDMLNHFNLDATYKNESNDSDISN